MVLTAVFLCASEKEAALQDLDKTRQLLTDREQQVEVLDRAYREAASKLSHASDHNQGLLRDMDVEVASLAPFDCYSCPEVFAASSSPLRCWHGA